MFDKDIMLGYSRYFLIYLKLCLIRIKYVESAKSAKNASTKSVSTRVAFVDNVSNLETCIDIKLSNINY